MSFNLQQLKQMATESSLQSSPRTLRIAINDFMDAHPSLRGDLCAIAQNRDSYRRKYDQERAMEDTIREYDQANGRILASIDIEPSRLIEYARDRVNRHLEQSAKDQGLSEAPRILRGRITTRPLLAGPAPAAGGEES
jgi:hypothetical protein